MQVTQALLEPSQLLLLHCNFLAALLQACRKSLLSLEPFSINTFAEEMPAYLNERLQAGGISFQEGPENQKVSDCRWTWRKWLGSLHSSPTPTLPSSCDQPLIFLFFLFFLPLPDTRAVIPLQGQPYSLVLCSLVHLQFIYICPSSVHNANALF